MLTDLFFIIQGKRGRQRERERKLSLNQITYDNHDAKSTA